MECRRVLFRSSILVRMMVVGEKISEAELVVMEALWERAPQTAADVADRVAAGRDWSVQTVKTLLSRLLAKDVIDADQAGRRFLYRPLDWNRVAKRKSVSVRVYLGGRPPP